MMKKLKHALTLFLVMCSTGCLDQDVGIGIWEVSSSKGMRLDESESHGAWEFKYTHKGRWNLSCRPPGVMTSLGLSYWTELKRDPDKDYNDKVFSGSRLGDKIELHIHPSGAAIIFMEKGDDTLRYNLRTSESAIRRSNAQANRTYWNSYGKEELLFLQTAYERN